MKINLNLQANDYYFMAYNTSLNDFRVSFERDISEAIYDGQKQLREDAEKRAIAMYQQYLRNVVSGDEIDDEGDEFLKWFVSEVEAKLKKKFIKSNKKKK